LITPPQIIHFTDGFFGFQSDQDDRIFKNILLFFECAIS